MLTSMMDHLQMMINNDSDDSDSTIQTITATQHAACNLDNKTLNTEGLPEGWTMQVAPNGRVSLLLFIQ